ncbi:diguanylate cyclase [uncultured Psychrosphaera sp.]|uniref:diguanylate cyclase n=1 Tax=uncultured Psychrosphaera sp. TaxID=1403522 RepID=UPI0030F746DA
MINKIDVETELNLANSTILVVDDQPINIKIVDKILSSEYKIVAATSGDQAIELCNKNPPDLILLDVVMPYMSGIETCVILKQRLSTAEIPIIFVTSCEQQDEEEACWENGGVDFINKPINPTTLKNRVKAHLTLKYQRDMLSGLVFIDYLTKVYNRRYFEEHITKLENSSNREKQDSALLLVDIDNFKLFNEVYGHIRGDISLKQVAVRIQDTLMRPSDFVARLGGGIFAVILPNTELIGAISVGEKIRRAVLAEQIAHPKSSVKFLTVSIGISTVFTAQKNMVTLLDDAEKYLSHAKQSGRNMCKHPQLV